MKIPYREDWGVIDIFVSNHDAEQLKNYKMVILLHWSMSMGDLLVLFVLWTWRMVFYKPIGPNPMF